MAELEAQTGLGKLEHPRYVDPGVVVPRRGRLFALPPEKCVDDSRWNTELHSFRVRRDTDAMGSHIESRWHERNVRPNESVERGQRKTRKKGTRRGGGAAKDAVQPWVTRGSEMDDRRPRLLVENIPAAALRHVTPY
jgi:hypothetical protein